MTREEKQQEIDALTTILKENSFFYLSDNNGLTAQQDNDLRRLLHKNGVTMRVTKNTLLKKAMENSGADYSEMFDVLKGRTALMISDNIKAPAVAIKKFREKSELPLLKGAFIDEAAYIGDNQLTFLTNIKTKEDLIGEIVTLLQSPIKNVLGALESGKNTISGIVKTLENK